MAKRAGIPLRQTHEREQKTLHRRAGGHAHAKQFKQLQGVLERQSTILDRLVRNMRRAYQHAAAGPRCETDRGHGGPGLPGHVQGAGTGRGHPLRQGQVAHAKQKTWLKRLEAIEALIGHTEAAHRNGSVLAKGWRVMCFMQCCLLRAIAKMWLAALFLR